MWRWPFWIGGVLGFCFVTLAGLPYFLPLGGPETVNPAALVDTNGTFVEIGDETLYYTHAAGAGETVVLLHGFGGSTVTWIDTLPALADAGFDVYALDLAGFGLSEKGWDYDYGHAAQAGRVIGFIDAMGIERASIVGHSMGGNVAAHLALGYPQRVDRLVLVAGAVVIEGEQSSHEFSPVLASLLDLSFVRRWGQILMRHFLASEFDSLLVDAFNSEDIMALENESGYQRVLNTPDWDLGLMGILRDSRRQGLSAPVSAIQAPTLLIWGTEDAWVSPSTADRLERLIPNVDRVDLDGVGHLPMHETPAEFNKALIAFLSSEHSHLQ